MAGSGRIAFPRSRIPPDLGDVVRAERAAKGWSQAELARRAGVARRTVVRLETGEHLPGSGLVQALERVLDRPGLVPGWPETADPAAPCYGGRVRAARRAAGVTLAAAARAAGVSASTLSRFEREMGDSPALVGPWGTAGEGVLSDALARAIGFADAAHLNRFCLAEG